MRARAIAIWMLGLPIGLGLANGAGGWILQNWGWRNAFYVAAVPGILCAVAALMHARAAARHARGARGRRPPPPRQSVSARAVDSDDAVDHRVGGAAQLQHVRARRVRRAVPRPLSPHDVPRRRLGRRRRLRVLRHRRADRRRMAGRSPVREARRRPADRRHGGDRHLRAADVPRPDAARRRRRRLRAADGHRHAA